MSGDSETFVCFVLLKLGEQKVVKPDNSSFTVTVTRETNGSNFNYTISISGLKFIQINVKNRRCFFINVQ